MSREPVMRRYYWFFGGLVVLSAIVIATQVWSAGPVKADRALAERIRATNDGIQEYARTHETLPLTLSALSGDHTGITYMPKGREYDLCGTFQSANVRKDPAMPEPATYIDPTNHPRGYHCFHGIVEPTGLVAPGRATGL